jgi:hypothetical protein
MPKPPRIPHDRLVAADLRELSDCQLGALRREAMRRGLSLPELLGQLVDEVSRRLLEPSTTAPA